MLVEPVEPDYSQWEPWDPATAAEQLDGVPVPWCVVGGWALDLFLGEQTRDHDDLELVVPQNGVDLVRDHGIPYMRPELVLFFKAKHLRDKDRGDFATVAPLLPEAARSWLRDAVASRYGDRHEWLARLVVVGPGTSSADRG